MCACAVVPFFRAQTIKKDETPATFIDGSSISNDPIMPVFEEACKVLCDQAEPRRDRLRIISVPLLPLRQDQVFRQSEPFTGLVEVMLRARQLLRFQDMLLDKSLIDRINRVLNGGPRRFAMRLASGKPFFRQRSAWWRPTVFPTRVAPDARRIGR